MGEASRRVVGAIERVGRAYRHMVLDRAKRRGLTLLQAQILLFLHDSPADRRRVMDVSRELEVSQPAVSDSVGALVRKGLVVKVRGRDGRSRTLSLTARGMALASELKGWEEEAALALSEALGGLGVEGELLELLLRYIASLYRRGAIRVARTCLTCRYVWVGEAGGRREYWCRLLGLRLGLEGLRVDCPEHVPVGVGLKTG